MSPRGTLSRHARDNRPSPAGRKRSAQGKPGEDGKAGRAQRWAAGDVRDVVLETAPELGGWVRGSGQGPSGLRILLCGVQRRE